MVVDARMALSARSSDGSLPPPTPRTIAAWKDSAAERFARIPFLPLWEEQVLVGCWLCGGGGTALPFAGTAA